MADPGKGYDVTARPAAVALSATQVQLAINETDVNLYEPLVTFPMLVLLGRHQGDYSPAKPTSVVKA
jgi:hypothetical protein